MSLQTSITQVIFEVGITTISELTKNIAYYFLIIWGVRTIVKKVPVWLSDYDKIRTKHYMIEKAIEGRKL